MTNRRSHCAELSWGVGVHHLYVRRRALLHQALRPGDVVAGGHHRDGLPAVRLSDFADGPRLAARVVSSGRKQRSRRWERRPNCSRSAPTLPGRVRMGQDQDGDLVVTLHLLGHREAFGRAPPSMIDGVGPVHGQGSTLTKT